jgi:hypothetical protein
MVLLERCEAVFAGVVVDLRHETVPVDESGRSPARIPVCTFRVTHIWKGDLPNPVTVRAVMSDFEIGEHYVVYAWRLGEGPLVATHCRTTKKISEALVDLYILPEPRPVDRAVPLPEITVAMIVANLQNRRYSMSREAFYALGLISDDHEISIPALQGLLSAPDEATRSQAVRTLGLMARFHDGLPTPATDRVIPLIQEVLQRESEMATRAVHALGTIAMSAAKGETVHKEYYDRITALYGQAFESDAPKVRVTAVRQAGFLARFTSSAEDLVRSALADDDETVRKEASRVLTRLHRQDNSRCVRTTVEVPHAKPLQVVEPGLHKITPNPFRTSSLVSYATPADVHVTLKVYDVGGRIVRTLVDGKQESGIHTVSWDGRSSWGHPVASGVYFYLLKFRGLEQVRQVVLLE